MVAFGDIWRVNYKSKNRHIYLYVELFSPNQTERLSNSKVIKVSKSQVVSLKQQGQWSNSEISKFAGLDGGSDFKAETAVGFFG